MSQMCDKSGFVSLINCCASSSACPGSAWDLLGMRSHICLIWSTKRVASRSRTAATRHESSLPARAKGWGALLASPRLAETMASRTRSRPEGSEACGAAPCNAGRQPWIVEFADAANDLIPKHLIFNHRGPVREREPPVFGKLGSGFRVRMSSPARKDAPCRARWHDGEPPDCEQRPTDTSRPAPEKSPLPMALVTSLCRKRSTSLSPSEFFPYSAGQNQRTS